MRKEEILDDKIYSTFDNANKCKCHVCYKNNKERIWYPCTFSRKSFEIGAFETQLSKFK